MILSGLKIVASFFGVLVVINHPAIIATLSTNQPLVRLIGSRLQCRYLCLHTICIVLRFFNFIFNFILFKSRAYIETLPGLQRNA